MGKKLNADINWEETNAGFGQVGLLFMYLMQKYEYQMSFIKDINLCANESYLIDSENNEILKLYGPIYAKIEENKFNKAIRLIVLEFQKFVDFL